MSDNGEIEVESPAGYPVLPKDVTEEIGSIKLFNKVCTYRGSAFLHAEHGLTRCSGLMRRLRSATSHSRTLTLPDPHPFRAHIEYSNTILVYFGIPGKGDSFAAKTIG